MTKILYSPGYGAGWSTWSLEHDEFMLKDPTLVEMAERNADESEVKAYIESKFPGEYIYTGGWRDIKVVDIPVSRLFRIKEYDGGESIEYADTTQWSVA